MQKHEYGNETSAEMMNCVQESDYLTKESFKIDENRFLNQDEKLKGEVVNCFYINSWVWLQIRNITGKQIFENLSYIRRNQKG